MNNRLGPQAIADRTNLTPARIRQMCNSGEISKRFAKKVGRDWWILPKAIEFIRSRPERRGRKRLVQNNGEK